jgi:hypothetical protein
MTDDRMGGLALIAGSAGSLVTMSLHPTGHDFLATVQFDATAARMIGVHALAIATMPISFLGALALSRRTAAPGRLALAALVAYAFALAAGLVAAGVSLAVPDIARQMLEAEPAARDRFRLLFGFSGNLIQAFAKVIVAASSAAIVLWSAAVVRGGALPRAAGIYGVVLGAAALLLLASGNLRLDAHGFGLVVLGQAIWFVAVGVAMWRA